MTEEHGHPTDQCAHNENGRRTASEPELSVFGRKYAEGDEVSQNDHDGDGGDAKDDQVRDRKHEEDAPRLLAIRVGFSK